MNDDSLDRMARGQGESLGLAVAVELLTHVGIILIFLLRSDRKFPDSPVRAQACKKLGVGLMAVRAYLWSLTSQGPLS